MGAGRIVSAAVVAAVAVGAGTASAGPKQGCAAAMSGWVISSVGETVDVIWPELLDYPGTYDDFAAEIAAYDANGNASLCLKTITYDNPNAHWAGTSFFIVSDDNAAAQRL
jgi:hypothetical protein